MQDSKNCLEQKGIVLKAAAQQTQAQVDHINKMDSATSSTIANSPISKNQLKEQIMEVPYTSKEEGISKNANALGIRVTTVQETLKSIFTKICNGKTI